MRPVPPPGMLRGPAALWAGQRCRGRAGAAGARDERAPGPHGRGPA